MKTKFILFFTVFFFCFLAFPARANMPNPIYLEAERQSSLFDKGLAGFDSYWFQEDLARSFFNFLIEFFVLGFLLFRQDAFKIKNVLTVFFTNMFTWLFFFGSTLFSVWYFVYLINPHFNPYFSPFYIFGTMMAELIIFILEAAAFILLFRKNYSIKRIILATLAANFITLLGGMLNFLH